MNRRCNVIPWKRLCTFVCFVIHAWLTKRAIIPLVIFVYDNKHCLPTTGYRIRPTMVSQDDLKVISVLFQNKYNVHNSKDFSLLIFTSTFCFFMGAYIALPTPLSSILTLVLSKSCQIPWSPYNQTANEISYWALSGISLHSWIKVGGANKGPWARMQFCDHAASNTAPTNHKPLQLGRFKDQKESTAHVHSVTRQTVWTKPTHSDCYKALNFLRL